MVSGSSSAVMYTELVVGKMTTPSKKPGELSDLVRSIVRMKKP